MNLLRNPTPEEEARLERGELTLAEATRLEHVRRLLERFAARGALRDLAKELEEQTETGRLRRELEDLRTAHAYALETRRRLELELEQARRELEAARLELERVILEPRPRARSSRGR